MRVDNSTGKGTSSMDKFSNEVHKVHMEPGGKLLYSLRIKTQFPNPPYYYYENCFQPASLASLLFINFQCRFNLVVGSLLSPLDLCNTPSSSSSSSLLGKCNAAKPSGSRETPTKKHRCKSVLPLTIHMYKTYTTQ
jgi:hypothetical protein